MLHLLDLLHPPQSWCEICSCIQKVDNFYAIWVSVQYVKNVFKANNLLLITFRLKLINFIMC